MHPSQLSRSSLRGQRFLISLSLLGSMTSPLLADEFPIDPAGTADRLFADGFDLTCRQFNVTAPANANEANFNWETGATCTQSPGDPWCPGSGFHFKFTRGGDSMGHELNFAWLNPYNSSNYSACATASYDGRYYCKPLTGDEILNASVPDWREGAGYPFAYDSSRKKLGFKFGPSAEQTRYGYAVITPTAPVGFPVTLHYACYGAVGATVIAP
jgi:hypothetical protein